WFGNLVTLQWWNDLWLNEGFASYVEYLGADSAEPSWNIKDLMVLNEVYTVMATDALTTSHPLSSSEDEVMTPAQISEVLDSIAYSKGASVLRMLSDFLTEDVFKLGLQSYLHTFAYNNTVYTDLWTHLQQTHFLLDPDSKVERPSVFNYTWIVPITWKNNTSSENRYWLTKDS
ncbi:PREDICTED: aminopeptidase N-like, partial [Buceros rhinoceros silvestris]|uniref:aminopeptidase N-like n=1 Tax=Buceros rhinoceros silvestris TaxID=175836 RepID=UPI0005294029